MAKEALMDMKGLTPELKVHTARLTDDDSMMCR